MKDAFTLIELLVVLVIMVLVMGVVVPKGSKMLNSYQKSLKKIESDQNLSKLRAEAFLQARDIDAKIDGKSYQITSKGVIVETSYDNR